MRRANELERRHFGARWREVWRGVGSAELRFAAIIADPSNREARFTCGDGRRNKFDRTERLEWV